MNFNQEYWEAKISGYGEEAWSHQPSPLARVVRQYLPVGGSLLELGTGVGQDAVWFASQGYLVTATDAADSAFDSIGRRNHNVQLAVVDVTKPLPFADSSFDAVYAQLVLHYFDDETTHGIYLEIERVLRQGGTLAVMVNTVKDEEYDPAQPDGQLEKGIFKRYFSKETLKPFVSRFETVIFDEQGQTPKDDAKDNSGMIRFIGKKR